MGGTIRTRKATAPRTTTLGDMVEQQFVQGVEVSTYFRRKVLEPGHLALDTSDKAVCLHAGGGVRRQRDSGACVLD